MMNTGGLSKCSLHIGDTVLFSTQLRNSSGYVYKELSSACYNFLTVNPTNDQYPDFPNIAFATFRVLARNKYQKKQELQYLEEKQSRLLQENQSSYVLKEFEKELLPYARKAVEEERLENEQEQQKKYGTKVVYGDFIQLQHSASRKFMTANSEASKTEGNHLLINLSEQNSEGAVFKILPRYKVKSVGDEVHYDDQIKLESIKTPGQFLHTSSFDRSLRSTGISINMNHYELNLSANESSFRLICHSPYSNSPSGVSLWLKAGDCIRFFHKQDECYVVAEGSFAEANTITENVHCRQRHVDQRRISHLPSSANTFWQIEKEQLCNSTSVIYWRERCRIKHLPTRLYLACCKIPDEEETWEVTLKEDGHQDVDTLFSFHPLIQEGPDVLLESYALIQHCSSRRWINLDKTEKGKFVRAASHPEDSSLTRLQWDSAELYKISTSKEKLDYNAFTVQEVSADLVKNFNYVAGIVPIFSNHLQDLEKLNESVPIKSANSVIESVKELSNWLITDNARETKNRQKLLRNLRVLAQLIEMLKVSKKYISSVHHCRILSGHCYTLLTKYLFGDSRKNENYLAQFIEFFQSQIHKGLNAEDLLVEIVQDNLSIVSRMAQTQMSEMIKEFRETKDFRFLDFLSSLCVCSGRPIPSIQDRLLKELNLKLDDEIFIRTRITHDKVNGKESVECYRPNSPYYIEISQMEKLLCDSKTPAEMGKADYHIFLAQLHLFARLCKGNNKMSINLLAYPKNEEGFVSFKEAILCAQNTSLSFKLRSKYVELILIMFVDVNENVSFLDNLIYSFIYDDDITEDPYENTVGSRGETVTKEENAHFSDLKKWLQATLKDTKVTCTEHNAEENYYLASVINVLVYLVRYGYYNDIKDVNECTKYLIVFLEGKNDCLQNCSGSNDNICLETWRINCPANRPVFAIKARVLEVFNLFYKFKFYVKLQQFIFNFKLLNGSARRKVGSSLSLHTKLGQFLLKVENESCFLYSNDMINAARGHLKNLCKDSQLSALQDQSLKPLVDLLIDISCYESEELNKLSLHLLLQMHYFEDELFEKAKQTQLLICEESIRDYSTVKIILPKLRHILRVDPDQKTQDDMIEILNTLCSLCILSPGSDEPNSQNQIMLNNFGIVSDILSYILAKGLDGLGMATVPGTPEVVNKEVYKKCFCLLKNLAADNKKIQAFLFSRVDDLLLIKTTIENIEILADLADLLTEVFTGGPDLILRIKESQIERIFEIIMHCKNPSVQAQFMLTLQALAKIEALNLPVKRNQEMIIRNFCRLRGEFCKEVLGEELAHKRLRAQILHFPERTGHDPRLLLLLSATDMLAACAEGKNLFIESICQNIFSLEELIDTIGSQLPPLRKRPFVRFLIWVYMKTADDKDENRKFSLKHGNIMWNYLDRLANFLENISSVLRLVPIEERSTIRQEFKEVLRPRTRTSAFSIRRPKLHSNSSGIPNIIGEDGSMKPGLLEFLVDGIIPLLNTYYMYFFNHSDAPSKSLQIREVDISAQIFNKLMLLQSELAKLFDVNSQVAMFQNTIRCFRKFPEVVERAAVSFHDIENILNMRFTLPKSLEAKSYEKQRELNKAFHRYTTNYSVSFNGPNNAEHQIGTSAIDKEYYDQGEELPLGHHFQNLIQLYYKNQDDETYREGKIKYEAEYLLYQLEVSRCRTVRLSEAEQNKQDNLDIRCLQLLRGLIHNQVKLLDPEEKERKPAKYREKSLTLFVAVQKQIQAFGGNGIQKIIPLLSHHKPHIAQEALALIKSMLFSGNISVQTGIEMNARETREETLFLNLKRMLETASQNYKDMRALQKQLFEENFEGATQNSPKPQSPHSSPKTKSLVTSKNNGYERHEVHISLDTLNLEADMTMEQHYCAKDDLSSILLCDNNWITLVLEVIGLMCDGQHKKLQDYLRDQPDNFKTVNVVAEVATFLHTYTMDLVGSDLRQINQILQTLVEMCVGNSKNQQVIFDAVVVEPLNRILELSTNENHNQCTKEIKTCHACQNIILLIKVKGSALELLEIMLEETTSEAPTIAEGIGYTIDIKAVLDTLNLFHKLQSVPIVKEQEMDDDCERGLFRAHNILVCFNSNKNISSGHSDLSKIIEWQSKEATFTKCVDNTLEIEIHYECDDEEPVLARVMFPYKREDRLRKEIKETVRWSINRDSMDDKHRALLHLMPSLKADIKQQQYLRTKIYWRPFISFHSQRQYLLLFLTFLLNVFILFLYKAPSSSANNSKKISLPNIKSWFLYLLYTLGSIHTLLSLWMVIEYFLISWPHFRLPKFFYKIPMRISKFLKHDRNLLKQSSSATCLDVNIFGVLTIYMIIFLVCSILSLVYFEGYFYPICLLYIIVNNDILQRVLRAVTKNGDALIFVAILGLVVLFIYAVISFAFLHNFFIPTVNAELYCGNLAQCMYSILRFGLLDNIGLLLPLNDTTTSEAPQFEFAHHYGRLIFDISFFIIVITIGLNVVFGIIVDTFSQLREEKSNVEEDEKSTCFICNLPSHEFDRNGNGFKHHICKEHNMWNYVYYSVHIDSIDTGDHNAIQKYVHESIKDNIASFFPQEKAKCLTNNTDFADTFMNDLASKLNLILNHFNEKALQKNEIAKQKAQERWANEVLQK